MEFLKSLVFPLKMRRFRHMSIFISIFIYFITVYILMFPYNTVTNNSVKKYIEEDMYSMQGISQMVLEQDDFSVLEDGGYSIADRMLKTTSDEEVVGIINHTYVLEGKSLNLTFIFDPYNIREEAILKVRDIYFEQYDITEPTSTELEKGLYISKMISAISYNDKDYDYTDAFTELHAKTVQELKEIDKTYNLFKLYNIENLEDTSDYLLVFYPDYFALNYEQDLIGAYYSEAKFNVTDTSSTEFGDYLSVYMMSNFVKATQQRQTFSVVLVLFGLPFILILIIWLFYRKNSQMKQYKEYYNLAAITSIIPTILVFIITWFWLDALILHSALNLVYFMYVTYKINTFKEIV